MPKLTDLIPYQDALSFPPKYDLRGDGSEPAPRKLTLQLASNVRYSQQLGPTKAWAYDGAVPGPTIIVDQSQTVRIQWRNDINEHDTLPYKVVVFPGGGVTPPQNEAGAHGGQIDTAASALTASTVTHLHGGLNAPDSDGWTENVYQYQRSQYATYGKADLPDKLKQRGTLLWYHDHAMGVTRLNVYAGLFGLWVLRDPKEKELIDKGVIPGERDELFLVIQDRNFAADTNGNLTGDLLHKTETETAEMFGPCTLVNGTLWPQCSVPAKPIRLRILNGSNARTYCLRVVQASSNKKEPATVAYAPIDPEHSLPIWQIGSDGGLFRQPVDLREPFNGPTDKTRALDLVLAPAERADLVIDFTGFNGAELAIVNTAFAPFHGSTVTNPNVLSVDGSTDNPETDQTQTPPTTMQPADPGTSTHPEKYLPFRLRFPHVLKFIIGEPTEPTSATMGLDTQLDDTFKRYVHDPADLDDPDHQLLLPAHHNHRWIALDENPVGNLTFRELVSYTTDPDIAVAAPASMPLIPIAKLNGVVTWYKTVAKAFHDAASFFIMAGSAEVWNILNLTGDTHPVHVHLVQFQVLSRQRVNASSYQTPPAQQTTPITPVTPLDVAQPPDLNELGFKDTVRVNPGEIVQIAAFFEGYCGKYMYHCHILEHEDHDMMRPIIVAAKDAFQLMSADMGGMGGMKM